MSRMDLVGIPSDKKARYEKDHRDFLAKSLPKRQRRVDDNPDRDRFEGLQAFLLRSLAYAHFGMPPAELTRCVNTARLYFESNWSDDDYPACRDKKPGNKDLFWFDIFRSGFLASLLADDTEALHALAAWTEHWMVPEPSDEDPLYAGTYLLLAAHFTSRSSESEYEKLATSVLKSRKKGPKLLLQAWQAAVAGDEKEFTVILKKSLQHFLETRSFVPSPEDYLAVHQSTVVAAARTLGMTPLALPPELEALLLTQETIQP